LFAEHGIEAVDTFGVSAPDGWHLNQISIDKLHMVIFGEDARLAHAVIIVHSEAVTCAGSLLSVNGNHKP
jgi:hypothetical protein